MKLEKFTKSSKKRNRAVIGILTVVCLLVAGFVLYKTYAFYEEEKAFNVLQGRIGDFNYDVKLAIKLVDGANEQKVDKVPDRGLYKVNAECRDGGKGEWDYNAWALSVENIQTNTKCNVTFIKNGLSDAEYQEYLEAGKSLRRNTYRGKDISSYLTASGEDNLYTQINSGTFKDIYVGDKIVSNGITWLVADIDNYLYSGDSGDIANGTKHHLTIIPSTTLARTGMNSTNTTEGGYIKSEMYTGEIKDASKVTTSLPKLLSDIIEPAFSGHVLEYRTLLPTGVDMEAVPNGFSKWTGASYDWSWISRKLDLMNEMNVYGAPVWSSSGYETGADNRQYAIFQLRPEMINSYGTKRFDYWLRNVSTSTSFAFVGGSGDSGSYWLASYSKGIRPRFLIG